MLQDIIQGRTDRVFDLIAAGEPATTADEHGRPLIRWCAYHGDVSALRYLLAHGESLHSLGENLDLSGAAFHGHWQLCQFLLEQGARADQASTDTGETPLHAALCKANRPIYDHVVQVLLAHGADPNARTLAGAGSDGFMRDVRCRGETPLHRAAAFGTQRSIRLLLEAGADRERKDASEDTPLSWASWHLRPRAVLRLLCYGAHTVRVDGESTYDHGNGWHPLDAHLRASPAPGLRSPEG